MTWYNETITEMGIIAEEVYDDKYGLPRYTRSDDYCEERSNP